MHEIHENRVCSRYMKWSGYTCKLCEKQSDGYTQRQKRNDYVLNITEGLYTQEGYKIIREKISEINEQYGFEETY